MDGNDELMRQLILSSEQRIDRVNHMVERLTAVIESNTILTLRVAESFEALRHGEEEKYRLMMDFLTEMRTTYDKHLESLEKSRNDAVHALHAQQECVSKLLDKVSGGKNVVTMSGIGNIEH